MYSTSQKLSFSLPLSCMSCSCLYALPSWYDYRYSVVFNLFANGACYLLHVLWQRYHHAHMFRFNAKTDADSLKLIGACRVLSASHSCCEVVGDNHRDIRLVVDGIQQSRHSRVGECRV